MTLLELPSEVFDRIIGIVMGSVSMTEAVHFRQVCHSFNTFLLDRLIHTASNLEYPQIFAHTGYNELFAFHGGAILSKKVLRITKADNTFIRYIQGVASYALGQQRWLDGLEFEQQRSRCTQGVCNALMAIDKDELRSYLQSKPIAKTAARNEGLYSIMPAIAASSAVASGQTIALSFMLSYLKEHVKGKPEADSWEQMRSAARGVSDALRVAVRLHKTDAGKMIFDFLADNRVFLGSTSKFLGERLIKDSMTAGNELLIYGAFAYDRCGSYHSGDAKYEGRLELDGDEVYFLIKFGHPNALRSLIRDIKLDSNKWSTYLPPLSYALSKRRYDMARVLLQNGADVDAAPKELAGKSPLWHAASEGHVEDVKLLLEYGAQPDHPKPSLSPLAATGWGKYRSKCRFLLKKVKEHGREYLSRPDLWDIYEKES